MKSDSVRTYLLHIFLGIFSVLMALPFLWMFVSSLKTKAEVLDPSRLLPAQPQWGNYLSILTDSPIPGYLGNSLFVALAVVCLQLICSTLFAYGITFLKFRGRTWLYRIVLVTYMVPTAATYIPCYMLLSKFHLLDTFQGLILSNGVSVFGIFLLRHAFTQLPPDAMEAARMDGAGHFTVLTHIVIPMTRPAYITFTLLAFIGTYNSYIWPSLITDSPQRSLVSQGLRRFLFEGGAYGTQWALVMAAGAVVVIPLLLLLALGGHWITDGIADGHS